MEPQLRHETTLWKQRKQISASNLMTLTHALGSFFELHALLFQCMENCVTTSCYIHLFIMPNVRSLQ